MVSTVAPSGLDSSPSSVAVLVVGEDDFELRGRELFRGLRARALAFFELDRDFVIAVHSLMRALATQRLHRHEPGIGPGRFSELKRGPRSSPMHASFGVE